MDVRIEDGCGWIFYVTGYFSTILKRINNFRVCLRFWEMK